MKTLLTTFSIIIITLTSCAQTSVEISDFEILNNRSWEGTLTYTDYQSGKPTDVDATLQITLKNNTVKTAIQYTYEPNKNIKSSVKLKKNGTYYGNERIIENTFENSYRTIKTTFEGKDDNRDATMTITYKFNEDTYTITKFVAYKGSDESLIRNTYKFKKIQ